MIRLQQTPDVLRLEVKDNGVGIAADEMRDRRLRDPELERRLGENLYVWTSSRRLLLQLSTT